MLFIGLDLLEKMLGKRIQANILPNGQWLFLVPLKGGRWHIIP